MEGFYKQLRTKKYLHQSVYSSGRKRLAVQSSAKVFWREPVTPHPRTDFWCALEKGVDCSPPSTFIQHLPGILQPRAHAVLPLGSVENPWDGGISALPRAISSPATWQDRLLHKG